MDRKLGEVLPGTIQTNLLGRTVTVCPGAMRRKTGVEEEVSGEIVALFAVNTLDGSRLKTLVSCGPDLLELWISEIRLTSHITPDGATASSRRAIKNLPG